MRRCAAHMLHQALELLLGAVRSKVSDLRLECDHAIGSGIDDGSAKIINLVASAFEQVWKAARLGIEAHTEHGVIGVLRRLQLS